MKKTLVAAVALAFVLLSAGAALAAITGSPHDMRTHITGEALGYDEVCVYCHTPHSSAATAQLWNRTNGTATFNAYTSSTLNASVDATLGAGSLLCLSCHDGTLAVDTLYNAPKYGDRLNNVSAGVALNVSKMITSSAKFDTDMTNDHPIGFTYPADGVDTGLVSISVVQNSTWVRLIGSSNNQLECASCHDAHSTDNPPFLRSTNQGSQLCLRCHIK